MKTKTSNVSKTQIKALREMDKTGLPLKATSNPSSSWVVLEHIYRITTLYALLDRKLIERHDTNNTPRYRRDYVLTEKGKAVIDEMYQRQESET